MAAVAQAVRVEDATEGLRAQVQLAAPGLGGLVVDALSNALQTTKRVWTHCPECRKKIEVAIPDARESVNAAKVLMEQAEGRPGVADGERQETLSVERSMESTVDAGHALALLDAGDYKALRLELVSSLPTGT
jgi:hypothetical protein